MDYAELHCLTNFTFLEGASHPEELVGRAAELGYSALAITDECSMAGVVRAYRAARKHGLDLLIGSELRLAEGPTVVLLAVDRDGYARLCNLIIRARGRCEKGAYHLTCTDLADGVPGCLALWLPPYPAPDSAEAAEWLASIFPGRAWIAAACHRRGRDTEHRAHLERLSAATGLPVVATGAVRMHRRGRRALQDVLTAIRLGTTVGEAGVALFPNGERHLRSREDLATLYPPDWLAESVRIAARCRFSMDELRYAYPEDDLPADESPAAYLRRLTFEGMAGRWPGGAPARVIELVEHELALIAELGYEAYFLTVHDIVRFARSRGILCQGRGSAANSAVCFCLGITEVDPARMATLFERFVSKERGEPPDIDVDFEHQRREEVIRYIYAKYGEARAALAATVIRYRGKSAVRDVGRALGLPAEQLDRLTRAIPHGEWPPLPAKRVREAGLDPEAPVIRRLRTLVAELVGFPRHLSQHVGGFVIGREPLDRLVPVEPAAMAGRSVIQWDKDDLDAMGLMKVDVLSLGMLTAIRRTFDLIEGYRGERLTPATVPPEDPATYRMIARADTVGVFQIESRAQMSMLPRLQPACFYDLVIQISIVRPGPIQGGMVHPYLRRREGTEAVDYPSEAIRGVLERTLGVPIFQEQVIQLAMVAAGFSAGEADQLRRSMAAWRKQGSLAPFRQRLIEGMAARGYTEAYAERIFRQIEGFGEYGFPESHAASFALLAYVSAWLKRHEPAAFTCALLNSQPMGFYGPAQLVRDAREHGVEVRPVDVIASAWECTLEPAATAAGEGGEEPAAWGRGGPALRLGLNRIRGFSEAGGERLVAARAEAPFGDITDLTRRARLDRGDLDALADAGALASLAGHRRTARWAVLGMERDLPPLADTPVQESLPGLPPPTEGQDLADDYVSLGLTLGRHPLALLRDRLPGIDAARLRVAPDGARVRLNGLVINRQRPGTASGTIFLTLEDETGTANIVVWGRLAERYRQPLLGARLLEVAGRVERSGSVVHLVAARLRDRSAWLGALVAPSRDFQ